MMQIFAIIVLSFYAIVIVVSLFTLLLSKEENAIENFIPTEKISILIPFKDEEKNILACLQSIAEQDFPKELIELVLIDDSSKDTSCDIANHFLPTKNIHYKLIHLKEKSLSGKKSAIEIGIEQATSNIIITRDADTFTNNLWLKTISYQFSKQKADLLIAPVMLTGNSFLQHFQWFESIAINTLGFSLAKNKLPFVCSGANLIYKKDCFLAVNPYQNNKHIASGDDMFLLQSFIKHHFNVSAVKNAETVVYSDAENTFSSFLHQRLRWASKGKQISIQTSWLMGLLLFLTNIITLICVIGSPFSPFCLFTLLSKFVIDFLLLFLGANMYKQKINFLYYLPAFIVNLMYVPFIFVASAVVKPIWKDQKASV